MKKDFKQAVVNYFQEYFVSHLHFSWRWASGVFMLSASFVAALFLFDPSMFSASLIQDEIYAQEKQNIVEYAEKNAGLLPDSPLYGFRFLFVDDQKPSEDEVMIRFAKVIKAAQKSEVVAHAAYKDFLEALDKRPEDEREELLIDLTQSIEDISIENDVFPFAYDVFALLDNETYWAGELVEYIHRDGSRAVIRDRAESMFTLLDQRNWEEKIEKGSLKLQLAFIKNALEYPVIEGEVFHAAAEEWMENNELYKSL